MSPGPDRARLPEPASAPRGPGGIPVVLEALRPLLGTWTGHGQSGPASGPSRYLEELTVGAQSPDRLVHFRRRTWHRSLGEAAIHLVHWEVGIVVPVSEDRVEVTRTRDGRRVVVYAATVARTDGGVLLTFERGDAEPPLRRPRLLRSLRVEGDRLIYEVAPPRCGDTPAHRIPFRVELDRDL